MMRSSDRSIELQIINQDVSTKLIAIQHEKKHGKGSKNSSAYFDSRIEIEHRTRVRHFNSVADSSFHIS